MKSGKKVQKSVAKKEVMKSGKGLNEPGEYTMWSGGEGDVEVLAPPNNLDDLVNVPPNSSILPQCIRLSATGVGGCGWIVEKAHEGVPDEQFKDEKQMFELVLKAIHPKLSFSDILYRLLIDRDHVGGGVLEVVRDKKGRFIQFEPLLPQYIYICRQDEEYTDIDIPVRSGDKMEVVTRAHRFRRYQQKIQSDIIYFSEWGDPRGIDRTTGKHLGRGVKGTGTEILYYAEYDPSTHPYGNPKWTGQIDNIVGVQDAEKVNRAYFRKKGMPSYIICVSGGTVPEKTITRITDFIEQQKSMDDAEETFFGILVVDAQTPDQDLMIDELPKPANIDIKPLLQDYPTDALFKDYTKSSRNYQRASFAINNVLTGEAENMSKASAEVAEQVVEKWTFGPARKSLEGFLNTFFERELQLKYTRLALKGPDLTNYTDLSTALSVLGGGTTPNDMREVVARMLGKQLDKFDMPMADKPIIMFANAAGLSAMRPQGPASNTASRDTLNKKEPDGRSVTKPAAKMTVVSTAQEAKEVLSAQGKD